MKFFFCLIIINVLLDLIWIKDYVKYREYIESSDRVILRVDIIKIK